VKQIELQYKSDKSKNQELVDKLKKEIAGLEKEEKALRDKYKEFDMTRGIMSRNLSTKK
jgi:hypothetical protein